MSTKESFDLSNSSELIPNVFHGDKFSVIFSNLPSQKDFKDFRYFHNYIKNLVLPEYSMDLIQSNFQGATLRHPDAPKMNRDLAQLMISFRLSEDMKNYMFLLDLLRSTRYGQVPEDYLNPEHLISKYSIKSIDVNLLDNHKRCICVISFLNCFCTMISSLNLEFGNSDEVTFSTNWSYSEMTYKTQTI